jgi:hypothetical protein
MVVQILCGTIANAPWPVKLSFAHARIQDLRLHAA